MDEPLAVDGQRERPAHPSIGEGGAGHVEGQVIRAQDGNHVELERVRGLVDGNLGLGQPGRDMELARAEGTLLRILVIRRIEPDLAEPDAARVPVFRVAPHANKGVGPPFLEGERPVAHEHARARPWAPALAAAPGRVERGHVDRVERKVGEEPEEVWRRIIEADDERVRVRGADPDRGRIGRSALQEVARSPDRERVPGVLASQLRVEDPHERVEEVPGGQGLAVRPAGVLPYMEGVREAVA